MVTLNKKKKHFEEKIWNVTRTMWDKEFQKASSLELKEAIRLDRDRQMETIAALELELGKDHEAGTKKELERQRDEAKEKADRYEKQMQMIDIEVEGSPFVSPDDPGRQGINDVLGNLAETKRMLESYVARL